MWADQAPCLMPSSHIRFKHVGSSLLLLVVGMYMSWLTCRLAISEWGVCKEGSGYRLQGKTNPGLLHHVLLTLKVNVDLHSKGQSNHMGGLKEG